MHITDLPISASLILFSTWLDQYANIVVEKASVYSLKICIPSIHEFLIHDIFMYI